MLSVFFCRPFCLIARDVFPVSGPSQLSVNVVILSEECCANVFVPPYLHSHDHILPLSVFAFECGLVWSNRGI